MADDEDPRIVQLAELVERYQRWGATAVPLVYLRRLLAKGSE